MTKVIMFANTSWYLWNFRRTLIARLVDNDLEVFLIAPDEAYKTQLTDLGATFISIQMSARGYAIFEELGSFLSVLKLYRKIRASTAFHFTIKPVLYGTFAGYLSTTPSINTVTGLGTLFSQSSSRMTRLIGMMIYRLIRNFTNWTFFQNIDDMRLMLENRLVRKDKCSVVAGSGIDLVKFPFQRHRKNSDAIRFLFIGRLIKDKGLIELADATRMIKAQGALVEVIILGEKETDSRVGIEDALFKSWITEGLFNYEGFHSDVRGWISKVDCVVLPSYREGLPRCLLEAAASGRPIVATDVPGCREIVNDGENGFLCRSRSAESLAHAMRRMIGISDSDRQNMGALGRKIVEEHFDQELVLREYLNKLC
jgi:glycosyltransferase involved in cell wall biosynthesis